MTSNNTNTVKRRNEKVAYEKVEAESDLFKYYYKIMKMILNNFCDLEYIKIYLHASIQKIITINLIL